MDQTDSNVGWQRLAHDVELLASGKELDIDDEVTEDGREIVGCDGREDIEGVTNGDL